MGPDFGRGLFILVKSLLSAAALLPLFRWWLVTNRESGSQAPALQTSRKLNRRNKFPPPREQKRRFGYPGAPLFFVRGCQSSVFSN